MIDKGKAWDYAVTRGWLTGLQITEATAFAQAGLNLNDIRDAIRAAAARADRDGARERHHALLLAMAQIDDARQAPPKGEADGSG